MNAPSKAKTDRRTGRRSFTDKLADLLRLRPRRHDPLLVLSLANFNSSHGWAEVFKPLKVREVVG